ncbi:ABC transporter ATP-binding protein [Mesobacillus zeae]|uniref:ABC transporter ATP-binding protein n=1 Tax=Mesobacillus zeae TaxID=1917180 RepID=A0A398B3F8_9BACI|nr:ABC transporter ATP-binding protein [Mesobacillus zeae]RID84405.1 ABC transporter ATP-binding protein [Mesobacillus zeae]
MKVLSFLKPYRIPMGLAISFMLIELGVELMQPLLIARIIDKGILQNDLQAVMKLGGIMLGLSLLAFAAGITNSFIAAYASQNFGYDLRRSLFEKIQAFSFADFNKYPASSLITRITNDVNQLQSTLFMSLRIAMRAPLLVIGGVTMAVLVNARLALVYIIVIPLLLLFLILIMNTSSALFKKVQGALDRVNALIRENLAGMRLIKAFARGDYEQQRFTSANHSLMERTAYALRLTETAIPVLLFIMNLTVLAVLWFGNLDIQTGKATVGETVAIVNYSARITTAFSMFSFIITVLSRAKASSARANEILSAETAASEGQEAYIGKNLSGSKVEFKHVNFEYPDSGTEILRDISFTAFPRETVALMGATGSGKSSLFQLIPRLYELTDGSIEVDGKDIREVGVDSLRRQIGYVPQEALLFTGSIGENLAWGKEDATIEEMDRAASHAQIRDMIEELPEKYDTLLGQKGVNLSGGQKQRLSIARALVKKPRILLLDDSTSALDLKTEASLLEALKEYQCTTLMITQKISTAKEADKILLLDDGRIIAAGTHEELLEHSSLYGEICMSQLGEAEVKK